MDEEETRELTLEERVRELESIQCDIRLVLADLRSSLRPLLSMYRTFSIIISTVIAFLMNLGLWFFFIR